MGTRMAIASTTVLAIAILVELEVLSAVVEKKQEVV